MKLSCRTYGFTVPKWLCTIPLLTFGLGGCGLHSDSSYTVAQAGELLAANQTQQAEKLISAQLNALGVADNSSLARAALLHALGQTYLKERRLDEAESCFMESAAIAQRKVGSAGVQLAAPTDGLRQVYAQQKKYAQAEQAARKVLAIADRAYTSADPRLETAISNVIGVACISGKCKDEAELNARLVEARRQVYGSDHANTRAARLLLAESYRHRGQYRQAVELLQQNVASCEKSAPSELITALNNVAHALDLAGDTTAASAAVDKALALESSDRRKAFPSEIINSLKLKARLLAKQGRYAQAEAAYAQLIAKVKAAYNNKNPHLADYLLDYSDVLAKNGKQKDSLAVHAEAERLYHGHP